METWYSYPNRYVCTVIENMRKYLELLKNHQGTDMIYTHLLLLVEEMQYHATKMEDALSEVKDVRELVKKRKKLEKKVHKLKKEKESLEGTEGKPKNRITEITLGEDDD